MASGRYVPSPSRVVEVPKTNGKTRPIAIPTLTDRVVQTAVKQALEPVFERFFLPCSHGYRPGRGPHTAIAAIVSGIEMANEPAHVIQADVANAFGTVEHARLLEQLRAHVSDARMLRLVHDFLEAGLMTSVPTERDEMRGIAQGSGLSPSLANLYLHPLDAYFYDGTAAARVMFIRYADDVTILVRGGSALAHEVHAELEDAVWQLLRMQLASEKTTVTTVDEGFDVLGFRVSRERECISVRPSAKSIAKLQTKLSDLAVTITDENKRAKKTLDLLDGWSSYFSVCTGGKSAALSALTSGGKNGR